MAYSLKSCEIIPIIFKTALLHKLILQLFWQMFLSKEP